MPTALSNAPTLLPPLPYFTQKLGRNPQVRSNHVLRHALLDIGIPLYKLQVTLLGRLRNSRQKPMLQNTQVALKHQPEHPFKFGISMEQLFLAVVVDHQQFTCFQGLNKQARWFPFRKTGNIAHPPILHRKLKIDFKPIFINIKGSDTTFYKVRLKITHLAFPQQKCFFTHRPRQQQTMKKRPLLVGEADALVRKMIYRGIHF